MKLLGESKGSKIVRGQLYELKYFLEQTLKANGDNEVGNRQKYFYAVNKNLNKIENEIKIIEKLKEPTSKFKEFLQDKETRLKQHAKKDESGKEIIINETLPNGQTVQRYDVEDMGKWDKEMDDLRETYSEAIKEQEDIQDKLNELLLEEVEIELYMIPLSYVLDDISGEVQRKILPIILEE